jgi:hypothetical protein
MSLRGPPIVQSPCAELEVRGRRPAVRRSRPADQPIPTLFDEAAFGPASAPRTSWLNDRTRARSRYPAASSQVVPARCRRDRRDVCSDGHFAAAPTSGEKAVDRVLLDGTTLAFAAQMLAGDEPPSALHLYALALLVESAILHEQVIVLDTSHTIDGSPLPASAQAYGAGAVTVERREVDDVVTEYVEREFPELEGLGSLSQTERRELNSGGGTSEQKDAIGRAERHLSGILERSYSDDPEVQQYLDLLKEVHNEQLAAAEEKRRPKGISKLRPKNWFYGFWGPGWAFPFLDGTPLGRLGSEPSISNAWEEFMRTYTSVSGYSPWEYHQTLARSDRQKFRPSLLARAHFYLLASEVMDAPYRPDGFRAPICWKFFGRGSFADLAVDEAFVRAAEKAQHEEVDSVNRLLQRRAFVALPFFLARVLRESRQAADVMRVTREIRESRDARRFRELAAQLRRDEEAGNVRAIAREMQAVSAVLRKEFGPSERSFDVLWTLAGSGGKAAIAQDPASVFDLGIKTGTAATKGLAGIGAWWRNRKLALISNTVKQAKRARDMQTELRRLFGGSLSNRELEVLDLLERLARQAPEPAQT